ncbi:MAG: AccI family restriction endonuclease [Phycisphaerae bacterium]
MFDADDGPLGVLILRVLRLKPVIRNTCAEFGLPPEHAFERALSLAAADLYSRLDGFGAIPWADFLLNPRRLRGSDFLMRWSQGVWSEQRLSDAVNATERYFAKPYGPSGTAPDNDVRAFELYFERLEKAGLGNLKRPDLMVFRSRHLQQVNEIINSLNGQSELPFTPEEDDRMRALLDLAVVAVECENSLWYARKMPDYNRALTPQRRLGGQLGLKKSAVLPTIIIKEEDRQPLRAWQDRRGVPIHIWHAFYDEAFGISLNDAESLFSSGKIAPTEQVYQAPGGATTRKTIHKIYHQYAYRLAETVEEPSLGADHIIDKNGHILPYVRFLGGRTQLLPDALKVLDAIGVTR